MNGIELIKLQSEYSYKELLDSFEGVSEQQAWAKVECQPGEYMHTEGSILSQVAHIAGCKFLYASAAYRDLEIRWRDVVERLEKIWPDWEALKAYSQEAHDYWLASWTNETDLNRLVKNFRLKDVPSWRILTIPSYHDSYHAGQIQVLRSTLPPSATPPPNEADEWRRACGDLPSW